MYHAVGFERRAAEVAEEALRLKPEVDDPEQIACMSMNVARALLDQGRHDDALAALRDAEQVYQSLDWPLPRARSQINRGIVQVSKGNLEGARGTFSEALEVLSEHPSEQADRAAVLNQLGRVHRLLGDLEQAKAYLKEARASIPDEDPFEAALNARELGLVLAASDHGSAQRELRKSADLFRSAGASDEAAAALLELGRMLKGTGQMDDAVKILEEGLELTASSAD
jgi:tetratricopeptide (TPR) repeat protein